MKTSNLLVLILVIFSISGIVKIVSFFAAQFPGQLNTWLYANVTQDTGTIWLIGHILPVILGVFAVGALLFAVICMYTMLKVFFA